MKIAIKSAWVAPMTAAVVRDAAVVIEGERIVAVGRRDAVCGLHPEAEVVDAGEVVVVPGLVNAHTHLELSHLSAGTLPREDFAKWVREVVRRRREGMAQSSGWISSAVLKGAAESLRFGVTCVGDITSQPHLSRPVLARSMLRSVSFGEVIALGGLRGQLEEALAAAVDDSAATERLSIGVSPHAPYTVELPGYRRCADEARRRGLVLTTHLAETAFEKEFLRTQGGPLRELWDSLGLWDQDVAPFEGSPIGYAAAADALCGSLIAHGNYCDAEDVELLARMDASVVYCPRTHAYFGHPVHPLARMRERGVRVVIGTDSTASSPDLNLLDEIRLVHRLHPEIDGLTLWRMVTTEAAQALHLGDVGALAPGMRADLAVFAAGGEEPLMEILESSTLPREVWLAGKRV